MSNPNPQTSQLKPFGSGKLTDEEEKEIRSKGGRQCADNARKRRNAQEILNDLLSGTITDKELVKRAKAWSVDEMTAENVLAACVMLNECRKGTIDSLLTVLDAAGRTDGATDEQAHAAFLHALTSDQPGTDT